MLFAPADGFDARRSYSGRPTPAAPARVTLRPAAVRAGFRSEPVADYLRRWILLAIRARVSTPLEVAPPYGRPRRGPGGCPTRTPIRCSRYSATGSRYTPVAQIDGPRLVRVNAVRSGSGDVLAAQFTIGVRSPVATAFGDRRSDGRRGGSRIRVGRADHAPVPDPDRRRERSPEWQLGGPWIDSIECRPGVFGSGVSDPGK